MEKKIAELEKKVAELEERINAILRVSAMETEWRIRNNRILLVLQIITLLTIVANGLLK